MLYEVITQRKVLFHEFGDVSIGHGAGPEGIDHNGNRFRDSRYNQEITCTGRRHVSDSDTLCKIAVELEKAPKIAVYTPEGKFPWDDAVTLALTYAA